VNPYDTDAFPREGLEWAHRQLAGAIAGRPGLLLEHKGLSLSLRYWRAPTTSPTNTGSPP